MTNNLPRALGLLEGILHLKNDKFVREGLFKIIEEIKELIEKEMGVIIMTNPILNIDDNIKKQTINEFLKNSETKE